MIKNWFILSLVTLGFCRSYGQSSLGTDSKKYLPISVLKLSVLSPLGFYPTAQVAYEHRIKNSFSAQGSLGYVLHYKFTDYVRFEHKRGVKLSAGARYYFTKTIHQHKALYLSTEFYNNIINFDRYGSVVKYREQGIALRYGLHSYGKKITFEANIGLALRFINYHDPSIRPGGDEGIKVFSLRNEANRTSIGAVSGISIGYRIK